MVQKNNVIEQTPSNSTNNKYKLKIESMIKWTQTAKGSLHV